LTGVGLPAICARALVEHMVEPKTKAMNNDSNWHFLVTCSFTVSYFNF
jgi:hypothetical protein